MNEITRIETMLKKLFSLNTLRQLVKMRKQGKKTFIAHMLHTIVYAFCHNIPVFRFANITFTQMLGQFHTSVTPSVLY
jgi:hypothetical protein